MKNFRHGSSKETPSKKFFRSFGDSTGFDQEDSFLVGVAQKTSNVFTIFIDNQISSAQDFRNATQVFHLATPDDEVNVILASPGGSIDGGMAFLQAEQECRGRITYFGSGVVASMAAIILCNAEEFTLHPHSSVMLHSASFGAGGPAIDTERYSTFMRSQCENFMNFYCSGVLSRDELKNIYNNKFEMWLTSSEFVDRWKRKKACQETMANMFKLGDVDPEQLSPEDYVELMLDLVDDYELQKIEEAEAAERAKRKPAKRKQKPVALPDQGCSGSCDCK